MIRSYLGCVEIIKMISRRLTKSQKEEILEAYKAGGNTNVLAEKYNCTSNTINRTVKTLLSETEYTLLKKKRSRINNKIDKLVDNKITEEKDADLEKSKSLKIVEEKSNEDDQSLKENEESQSPDVNDIASLPLENSGNFSEDPLAENLILDKNIQNFDNNFEEIAPLVSNFDFDTEKKDLDFEIHDYESLPESVYMIVDKKVELDLQPISDLPEWDFLPENELQRNAILLFSNQRAAKRICSRNQRVIKVPNTSIFKLSKSYLISKGITRLILEDLIIGLDN